MGCPILTDEGVPSLQKQYPRLNPVLLQNMPGAKHKKKKKVANAPVEEGTYKPPRSFIFKRGSVGVTVRELVDDMRQVMAPNTAVHLQAKERNSMKDFVSVSGQLGVTQFFVFSATEIGTYMRLMRVPHGPTLTFRILSYSLMSDVHKLQARPKSFTSEDRNHAPILILNNFSSEENHVKLMASAFQNAFPALNVQDMKLKDAKRVVLIHHDKEDGLLEFRHYIISTTQLGISKSVKRLLQRRLQDMGSVEDIADYIMSQTGATESDAEDMANIDGQVDLPDSMVNKTLKKKKKKLKPTSNAGDDEADAEAGSSTTVGSSKMVKSAVRLTELGPRMQLKLIKVEDGLNDGMVLYHALKTKTEKEVEALERKRARKAALKEKRRKEQEERVARKKKEKEGDEADAEESDGPDYEGYRYEEAPEPVVKPDDVEWYRKEVGEEPTEEEKRELLASQPVVSRSKYNPHWSKKNKKRSGQEVSGGRGSQEDRGMDGKPPKKQFKTASGHGKRSK